MATLTITFSAAHATRIQDALEESMDLRDENGDPRAATMADFKDYVMRDVKQFVLTSERRVASRQAASAVDEIALT